MDLFYKTKINLYKTSFFLQYCVNRNRFYKAEINIPGFESDLGNFYTSKRCVELFESLKKSYEDENNVIVNNMIPGYCSVSLYARQDGCAGNPMRTIHTIHTIH